MARPGLDKHPKFLRLMRDTGERRSHCRGYLDCLWETAYEAGNPIIGDEIAVELAADWPGEPGKLVKALSEAGGNGQLGFIEQLEDGRWMVHDLYHHAPDYVQRRMQREAERIAKGKTLTELRSEAGRKGGQSKRKQVEATDGHLLTESKQTEANGATRDEANGATPAPAPTLNTLSPDGDGKPSFPSTSEFVECWNSWAREHGFATIRKVTETRARQLAIRIRQKDWLDGFLEALKKLPLPGEGWQPTLDWLIKNETNVFKVVEGTYDWRGHTGNGKPKRDPNAPYTAYG